MHEPNGPLSRPPDPTAGEKMVTKKSKCESSGDEA